MELKKLHMGTMSYSADSMDEVAHQLALAFGLSSEQGNASDLYIYNLPDLFCFVSIANLRQGSIPTGIQFATRGRRDMSSRVKDVVTGLALCHNVSTWLPESGYSCNNPPRLHLLRMTMDLSRIKHLLPTK